MAGKSRKNIAVSVETFPGTANINGSIYRPSSHRMIDRPEHFCRADDTKVAKSKATYAKLSVPVTNRI